jgi:hypothetical protein
MKSFCYDQPRPLISLEFNQILIEAKGHLHFGLLQWVQSEKGGLNP